MDERLLKINRLMEEVFNDILTIETSALKKSSFGDVSISEVHTMEAIGLHSRKTMSETARELGVTVGTLTVAVNNLVKKGYVERFKSEDDRRVVKLGLTKKGKVLFRAHQTFHRQAAKESVDSLTDGEIDAFLSALTKVHRHLEETYIKKLEGGGA